MSVETSGLGRRRRHHLVGRAAAVGMGGGAVLRGSDGHGALELGGELCKLIDSTVVICAPPAPPSPPMVLLLGLLLILLDGGLNRLGPPKSVSK